MEMPEVDRLYHLLATTRTLKCELSSSLVGPI